MIWVGTSEWVISLYLTSFFSQSTPSPLQLYLLQKSLVSQSVIVYSFQNMLQWCTLLSVAIQLLSLIHLFFIVEIRPFTGFAPVSSLLAPNRVPEQEAVSSVLKQGGLCLETRGTDGLGLAECRGLGANRPQSQVRTLPLEGDLLWLTVIVRNTSDSVLHALIFGSNWVLLKPSQRNATLFKLYAAVHQPNL